MSGSRSKASISADQKIPFPIQVRGEAAMKIKGLILAMAVVLCCAAAIPAPAQAAKQKFSLVYGGDSISFLLAYVALGAGLFEAEGLDVDFVNVGSGPRAAAAAMSGAADLSIFALPHVISAHLEGSDLVAVSTLYNNYPVKVVLSPEAITKTGIAPGMSIEEKTQRLHGLKLAISSPGSAVDQFIRSVLVKRGINPDSALQLQPLGTGTSILAAFERKIVDGFVYPAPLPEIAETRGLGKTVIDATSGEVPEANDVPWGVFGTGRATLAARRDVILAALRGIKSASQFVQEKPIDDILQAIKKYFSDVEPAALRLGVESLRHGVPKSLVITPEQVDKTIAWLRLTSTKNIEVRYDDIVAPELARSIEK
jgi:NitT/TauT family transport system substrate-binding protein